MLHSLKLLFEKISIKQIILIGLFVRLLAAFFSPGYAFHDDHFEMPELVFKWQDNVTFLWTGGHVDVNSLIYPGLMYLIFKGCNIFGISSPENMMLVVRLVHALFSLLTIYYSYLLALRLTHNKTTSHTVAMVMTLFWFFPFLSVRNLREFFCVPFLLIACYYITDPKLNLRSIFLSALFFAFSFCIRIHILFIPFGVGLCLLLSKKNFWNAVLFGFAFIVSYFLTQGLFDLLYYGDPFASLKAYIAFNSNPENITIQPQGPWYKYIGTLAAYVLGIPVFLLSLGYIYSTRISFQAKMLFWGSMVFFAFHSYYSNKQERFILPFIPLFLLLGMIGLAEFLRKNNSLWLRRSLRITLVWFLIFNSLGLAVLTFTYSKRSRIESMIYLRKKGDVSNLVMEGDVSLQKPPLFYLGKHVDIYTLSSGENISSLDSQIKNSFKPKPNYVIMAGNKNFDKRLDKLKGLFPSIQKDTVITSGFVDNLAHYLNPKHNQNEDWYIFHIK